jgi:two-component system, OmpR family, response regulator
VDIATTGERAVRMAGKNAYDAIVLDILLPDMDGFEVCSRLRQSERWVPVLMLTARDAVEDRVRGLDVGADDYMTKPFAFPELFARLRALLRRGTGPRPAVLEVGDLVLDPRTHEVYRGGRRISLTAKEFALLDYLMRHPEEVISRGRLSDHVWGFGFAGDPHVVSVYVGYLRDKIDRPFDRTSLETIRGAGYRLRDDRSSSASH